MKKKMIQLIMIYMINSEELGSIKAGEPINYDKLYEKNIVI